MAADNKLELVIQVDADKANASIKTVNKGLSGIEKTAVSSTKNASRGFDGMTLSMTKAVVAGNAIFAALKRALVALKDFTFGAIRTTDEIGKSAQKIGVSTEVLSALKHAGELSAVTFEQIKTGVARFSGVVLDASYGLATYTQTFDELGINIRDQRGNLRRFEDLIGDVAERFSGMEDGTKKTALAMDLFGRAGAEMIPLLNQDRTGIREMTDEARQLGLVISKDAAQSAAEFNDNLTRLKGALEGIALKIAQDLLHDLVRFTNQLVRMVKEVDIARWAREAAAEIRNLAEWVKNIAIWIVAYGVVTKLISVVRALGQLRLAALGVVAVVNPWQLLAIGIATFGVALYREKRKLDEMNRSLAETNRQAAIFAAIRQGQTLEQLTAAGFSEEDIRAALGGRKQIPGTFPEFSPEGFTRPRIGVGEEDRKLAAEIERKQAAAVQEARAFRRSVEEAMAVGPAKAILEAQKEIEKLTTFVDEQGVEHRFRLVADARENIEKALQLKLRELARESGEQILKREREQFEQRLGWETELYQKRLAYETDFAQRAAESARNLLTFQEERAGFEREAQLRQLELTGAQTLEQRIAVEARRAEIEIEHARRVHDIRMQLFDLETDSIISQERLQMQLLNVQADEIERRIADLRDQREAIQAQMDAQTQAAVDAARENAAIRQGQIVRDEQRRIFDSLKRQAEGVFDALLTRSRSVFGAIGDALKTAILTAIKEVVTSRVAAMLMQLFGGLRVPVAGVSTGFGTAGAIAGATIPLLGGGGVGIPGIGPGGTPPFIPTTGGGGIGSFAGLAGSSLA